MPYYNIVTFVIKPEPMRIHYAKLLDDCELKTSRIDIWQYPLHHEFSDARALLPLHEQSRADRFHFQKHQRRFIVAHSILRLILAHYLQHSEQLEFQENHYGKPELSHFNHLQFNLSHSGDEAVLAVGHQFPLGVDLEHFSARPYYGIAQQLFSEKENQMLRSAPDRLTPLVFFNIWVQKEAFIKAVGLGLSYPTQQFDVPPLPKSKELIQDSLYNSTWQMSAFMPSTNCCAAICHHPDVKEIRYTKISQSDFPSFLNSIRKIG